MLIFAQRASAILFNLLKSMPNEMPFLLPSNICPIVPLVFLKARRPFEFIDISEHTLCMDEALALEKLTNRPDHYAGILFVRTYGVMTSFDSFFNSIKEIREELIIIDDRCLSIPDFNCCPDACSDVILYSTGYSKFVDMGFGGYAYIRNNYQYTDHIVAFDEHDHHIMTVRYKAAIEAGIKFIHSDSHWLDNSEPEIPFADYRTEVERKIPQLSVWKDTINEIYTNNLPQSIQLASEYQRWRFNILVPDKEKLLSEIFKYGLFASAHYASLDGIFSNGKSPKAEKFHTRVLNLFNDRHFDSEKAYAVAELVDAHLRRI